MRNIIYFILTPWRWYKNKQEFKRRMKELQEQDPYIYK